MKISLNRQLDTGQLLDLENHLIETIPEPYVESGIDLDRFAIDGTLEIPIRPYETDKIEMADEIISFLELNIPRIIIWKDDKKVVDKFGNSPLDLEAGPVGEAEENISAKAKAASKAIERAPYTSRKEIGDAHAAASELHHAASKAAASRGDYAYHFSQSVQHQKSAAYYGGRKPVLDSAVQATPESVVNKLLEDEDLQPWKNPKNWMDKFAAARFVDQAVLDDIPNDAKICVVHGGEIADAILYNDFRGGIHVLIDDGEVSRWRGFKDEETAYGEFLRHDVHAS